MGFLEFPQQHQQRFPKIFIDSLVILSKKPKIGTSKFQFGEWLLLFSQKKSNRKNNTIFYFSGSKRCVSWNFSNHTNIFLTSSLISYWYCQTPKAGTSKFQIWVWGVIFVAFSEKVTRKSTLCSIFQEATDVSLGISQTTPMFSWNPHWKKSKWFYWYC